MRISRYIFVGFFLSTSAFAQDVIVYDMNGESITWRETRGLYEVIFATETEDGTPYFSNGYYSPGNNVEPEIGSYVIRTENPEEFLYNYIVTNGDGAASDIIDFSIFLESNIDVSSVISPAASWYSGQSIDKKFVLWSHSAEGIEPGSTTNGFSYISASLPKPVPCLVAGDIWLGGFDDGISAELGAAMEQLKSETGGLPCITIGPSEPLDGPSNLIAHADSLLDYLKPMEALGWINDSNLYNEVELLLESARTNLLSANHVNAATQYVELLTLIEDERKNSAKMSLEAYGILKYNTEYILEQLPVSAAAVSLQDGWQMAGLPVDVPDPYYENVYSYIPLIQPPFWWNGTGYVYEEQMILGHGYWTRGDSTGLLYIAGSPAPALTLDMIEGWNMISGPSCDFDVTAIDDLGGIIALPGNQGIFGWDESYYPAIVFEPGNGYWILTTSSGQITLDCSTAPGKRGRMLTTYQPEQDGFSVIVVRDDDGRSQRLFIGGSLPPQNRHSYALPPIPPIPNSFDARFTLGSNLVEGNLGTVVFQSNAYPVMVEAVGMAQGRAMIVEELTSGQVVATRTVDADTPFEITNPAVNALRIRLQ